MPSETAKESVAHCQKALAALVRVLARQAAREMLSDRSEAELCDKEPSTGPFRGSDG
jgi:hypothetical protein